MAPTPRKHIKKKTPKLSIPKLSASNKRKVGFGALGIVGVAVLVFVILCFVFATQNTANPTHFVLNERLDCTINSDKLIYDEANNCDCLEVNMTFKNVTRPYDTSDPNMRTADQLSQEEQDALTEEQKEEINRNTILKRASEAQTQFDISAVLFLQPSQNGAGLVEPGAELRADGKENNADAMSPRLAIGESANVLLYFRLANQSDVKVTYLFGGRTQQEDGSFTEEFGDNKMSQEVTFARAGQTTPQL